MTQQQITLLLEQERRLLEGWRYWRAKQENIPGEAGELARKASERHIAECEERIEKFEKMMEVAK